jgi:hypothetical protein
MDTAWAWQAMCESAFKGSQKSGNTGTHPANRKCCYRVMDHDPYTAEPTVLHFHLIGPLTKAPGWQAICNRRRTEGK